MFYYLYQITNNLNGKIYVGVHKTNDLNDGYMGSGKVIKRALTKHGVENFEKAILETFKDEKSMYAREKEIVTDEFLSRDDVYNLRRGGTGGFDYINTCGLNGTLKGVEKRISVKENDPCRYEEWEEKRVARLNAYNSSLTKEELSLRGRKANDTFFSVNGRYSFQGIQHSDKTKAVIGEKNSIHQKGDGNSQYGTMWITNGVESKKIKKGDSIPDGYMRGRIIK